MSVEAALAARAVAHAGLTALISDRFYADQAEQESTAPFCVFQTIGGLRERTFGKRAQIVRARIQIDAYATTKSGAVALARQVVEAFDQWSGSSGGITVHDSALEDERTLVELPDKTGQLYRYSMDFVVQYANPAYA
jgi:hypothetical protein